MMGPTLLFSSTSRPSMPLPQLTSPLTTLTARVCLLTLRSRLIRGAISTVTSRPTCALSSSRSVDSACGAIEWRHQQRGHRLHLTACQAQRQLHPASPSRPSVVGCTQTRPDDPDGPWLRRSAGPRCCCLPLVATFPRPCPATPGAPISDACSASPGWGGVLFFPESGVVFSHTHFSAFLCIHMYFCAFYCIFKALGRAAFYKSVTFSRILEPFRAAAFF